MSVFEKMFLKKIKPKLEADTIISKHQFGFWEGHTTVEQVHHVVHKTRQLLERKEYCSIVFLNIRLVFNSVWHKGLLLKLKLLIPNSYCMFLQSYFNQCEFQVKYQDELSNLYMCILLVARTKLPHLVLCIWLMRSLSN